VPKLWSDTVEAHRRDVREAILDTTWLLACRHGPASVRMSEIAEHAGIGRATLYKYFSDVDAILAAWHHRQIESHLAELAAIRDGTTDPARRLIAVLEAYARIHQERARHRHGAHSAELAALLHTDDQVARAQRQLHGLLQELIEQAMGAGEVRDDVPPAELADFCLHALTAAAAYPAAAVPRLVTLTRAALRPDR
jgi:AcrR family transcriptional regulator